MNYPEYRVYYSCLLKLEYFDAVRFTAIDPGTIFSLEVQNVSSNFGLRKIC